MAETCKRSDGRGWRCGRPAAAGKNYCETHILQASLRQKRQPVPDHLKLERAKRASIVPKSEENSDDGVTEEAVRRSKRKVTEESEGVSDEPRKRVRKLNLKLGRMEIAPGTSSSTAQQETDSPAVKSGASSTSRFKRLFRSKNSEPIPIVVQKHLPNISENLKATEKMKTTGTSFRRPIRSKNTEPIPIVVKKHLPSIKENVKASAKKEMKKIIKKCHWCGLRSFCVLVKCSTCKKNFFCQECINLRFYCEKTVRRECPVCQGECPCRACTRGIPKQVKTKEPVIHDLEDHAIIICDTEKGAAESNREKMSDFDQSQKLHMIRELLPVMTKLNEEKIIELDTEAKNKGPCHGGLEVQIAEYTQKKECSFCKACIPDVHRSCDFCSFILCLVCCHDHRDGYLHSSLENVKETRIIRSKDPKGTSWRHHLDGCISCPPKNLGGCERGLLRLTSFYPFSLTKDLEESAKKLLCNFPLNGLSDSSSCLLCDENVEAGLYFSTQPEFKDNNLEHFMKHWGKGQPVIIRDVIQNQPYLNWGFGFMLCTYLEKSAESRHNTGTRSAKSTRDWCDVEFTRKQKFSGGITHENVWSEFLKYKLWFSSDFLQDHFPDHYDAMIQSLPLQDYMNPFTGFLNLGAYSPYQTKNPNLGSYVCISYGGLDNPMNADLLTNLRLHAYDMVNVLVHAAMHPISERRLNEVKMVMKKYNSHDHLNSSKKIVKRNKLEEMFASSSRLEDTRNHEVVSVSDESESESESDDEVSSQVANGCGAQWDIFRREDVPMLLEYLKKYSDKLSRSHGSSRKLVHPLFDEVFYLDDDHKARLKEEFNVDALSFEQKIGEAIVIPAGCSYQMKKIKSCVHVVYEFMSPESALESIKVSDEIRLLPVNHKAKGNMVQVKEMAINRMHAAIEEMREAYVSQPEWSWPFVISHLFCSQVVRVVSDFSQSLRLKVFNWLDCFAESQRDGQHCPHSMALVWPSEHLMFSSQVFSVKCLQ
ncbi:hypothetical protein L1987_38443 [Smallanthus sonchifolius]|uniref:Uncharacterized protein n=1 Tax=Smallanthus sonchifolius TaxID=185202 RepID=A0ACB9HJ85_9ASTR|nr:hypothetical protein L1987_38443 [Smallanthus sonchifolius]